MNNQEPLMRAKNVSKTYQQGFNKFDAVSNISLDVFAGETLGLVGESGCGKSTLGKMLLHLENVSAGDIYFKEKPFSSFTKHSLAEFRRDVQMIFQDPYSSLNPRKSIEEVLVEPLKLHFPKLDAKARIRQVTKILAQVGLPPHALQKYPHEFSGGQRQRIGIARALTLDPKLLICDEPISALDVSVQAQIINLLKDLQVQRNLTLVFIAHDLAMIKYLSTRVAVMYLGHIVELASGEDLYHQPLHPYTQALLSAIPIPNPFKEKARTKIILKSDAKTARPSQGCPFAPRCPHAQPLCSQIVPTLKKISENHTVACHLLGDETISKK